MKDSLINQLNKVTTVCLTIDLWPKRQMELILGITGRYIKDWIMKSVMIACERVKEKPSCESIHHEYEKTTSIFFIYVAQ